MKKLSMLLAFCLLSVSLCGCQSQLTSSSQSSEVSAVSASSTAQEGDPVVICLDESLEQDMEELIRYLEASGNETEYELLVLPEDTEDAQFSHSRHGDQLRGDFGAPVPQRGEKHVFPPVSGCGGNGPKQ